MKYCGSARSHPYPLFQYLCRFAFQDIPTDDPRTIREGMVGGDLETVDGQPKRSRADF